MKQDSKSGPTVDIASVNSGDLSTLREKTGFFKKFGVDLATSREAANGLKKIQIEQVKTETNIALTALKLAEAGIRTSMVANAMPAIGALTVRVNAATTSVDQALTNSVMAETYTHLNNRSSNIKLAHELSSTGKISQDEADVVISFAQADAAQDIQRSRQRMNEAKDAVAGLHEFALKGIAEAKDRLS